MTGADLNEPSHGLMDGLTQERQQSPTFQLHMTNTKSNRAITHSLFPVKHTAEFLNRHIVL